LGVGTRIRQARTVVGMYERDEIFPQRRRAGGLRFFEDAGSEVARVGLQITMDELEGLVPRRAVVWGVTALDEIGA
jgi:hypothetical protein